MMVGDSPISPREADTSGGVAPGMEVLMREKISPRRVRVERGIYKRQTPSGVAYEFTYTDSTGRQRWQAVRGGLRDARRERADVVARLGRGERVAPTRRTFAEVAEAWLENERSRLRPRTIEMYEILLRVHLLPRFGRRRLTDIDTDNVAALVRELRLAGRSAYTARNVLTVLGRVLGYAVRRGMIPSNPVRGLERGERPKLPRRELRLLTSDEIAALLSACDLFYYPLVVTALFSGARQGELLGLRWQDIDFDEGVIRVRQALDRHGQLGPTKTDEAVRDIAIMPALAQLLRSHREAAFARGYAKPTDFVFCTRTGKPHNYRNVSKRGLDAAVARAGLDADGRPKPRWHDLRHAYASILISHGHDIAFVSRQLGHSRPTVTLDVYAHLFDPHEQARRSRDAMEASFGELLSLG
jgi:integrase